MRRSFLLTAALGATALAATAVTADAGGRHGGGAMVRPMGVAHPAGFGGMGGHAGGYRALPPVQGTLRPGPHGIYGDRSFGHVNYAGNQGFHGPVGGYAHQAAGYGYQRRMGGAGYGGAAVYNVGRGLHRGFARRGYGGAGVGYGGYGYGDAGYAGAGYDNAGYGYDGGAAAAPDSYAEPTPSYAGQGYAPVAGTGYGYGPVTYQRTAGYGYASGVGYGSAYGVYSVGAYSPGPSIITIPSGYNSYHAGCGCHGGGLFN